MKNILLVTAMLFISTNATGFGILGQGSSSCGTFISDYDKKDSGPTGGELNLSTMAWIDGFISGINFSEDKEIGTNVDKQEIELWVYNYCKTNPSEDVSNAAIMLIKKIGLLREIEG